MIISITGVPGSGKSTVSKKIAEILNLKRYYIGKIQRERAKEMGMTIHEYNKWSEDPKNAHADTDIEKYIEKLGKTEDNFIIESRTAHKIIPHSIKIMLTVDTKEAARRIIKDIQEKNDRNEAVYSSVEEAEEKIKERMNSEKKRYMQYYNIDPYDKSNFDIIIDTTNLTPEEVISKILEEIKKHQ